MDVEAAALAVCAHPLQTGALKRGRDLPRAPLEVSEPGQRLTVLGQD